MNEPMRLRDGDGAARRLMAGAVMHVPGASRRRAVAFTSAATTVGASTVAIAASGGSVIKSFVLCVALGTVGGGVVSLAVSETITRLDTKSGSSAQSRPNPAAMPAVSPSLPREPEAAVAEEPSPVAAPPVTELVAKDLGSKGKALGQGDSVAPSLAMPGAPIRPAPGSSLFEEQRIIESARAAMARGDVRSAFSLLDNYEQAYASKQFWPEALALRIEALRSSGQLGAARALAADFAQKYPHHPLLARVQSIVAK